ncbi:CoA transferase, partial [Achromobacter sp.]
MDALKGLRVVDFSKVLAGPLCTQYLGDMGAEVIKVEPLKGDDTRRWPPFRQDDGTVFLSVNRNK